jgi:CDP-diacylglycerol pyrophosphatase
MAALEGITIGRIASAAAAGLLLTLLAACTTIETAPQPAATVQAGACRIAPSPNTLLSLARCCAQSLANNPSCREYNPERSFVILKDNASDKPAAYLIIPATPVTGIEDKQVFHSPVADIWQYGWEESTRFLRVPYRVVGLAINSVEARSQNQLHIHISCVRPAVANLLERARRLRTDTMQPSQLRLPPGNHLYRVVVVHELLRHDSPFEVVSGFPGAKDAMARQSIAVIGSRVPETYYLLSTAAGPGNPGSAEELLDQTCARAPRE